jgi:hypothetical protein
LSQLTRTTVALLALMSLSACGPNRPTSSPMIGSNDKAPKTSQAAHSPSRPTQKIAQQSAPIPTAAPSPTSSIQPSTPTAATTHAPAAIPTANNMPNAASNPTTGSSPNVAATPEPTPAPTPKPTPTPIPPTIVTLEQNLSLYALQNGVLVPQIEVLAGSQIAVPYDYQLSNADYKNVNGSTERSSTGFIYPVTITSAAQTLATPMDQLNQTAGGLYVSAAINGAMQGFSGSFNSLKPAKPSVDFLKYFSEIGQPKFGYLKGLMRRFSDRLNKGVDPATQSPEERTKWQKIFNEIKANADRTVETPKSLLMMEHGAAKHWSMSFDSNGSVAQSGTWAIAIQTAIRHGFPETPCAEFMSEIVRQSYLRAGYEMTKDFNTGIGNELIWKNTAAVLNFSRALYKAGWVPWESAKYRPITGAFMMEGIGQTPGHTFISAGDDGMFIVDNASPQGRDLRQTPESIIRLLYDYGVFFLPPGINPPEWPAPPPPVVSPTPTPSPAPTPAPRA